MIHSPKQFLNVLFLTQKDLQAQYKIMVLYIDDKINDPESNAILEGCNLSSVEDDGILSLDSEQKKIMSEINSKIDNFNHFLNYIRNDFSVTLISLQELDEFSMKIKNLKYNLLS